MTATPADLYWMSNAAIADLNSQIRKNLHRYRSGDFLHIASAPSWKQKSLLKYDPSAFGALSGDSKNDLPDALLIFEQLSELPPRLATCMNVWIRLIHTDLLDYTRRRWLTAKTDKELIKQIEVHVFKGGVTGYRDDNAAARPWWTAYIGSRIADSEDVSVIRPVLNPFMRTTDTRSNVIERPGIFSERGLAKHISDYLAAGHLPDAGDEATFRSFIRSINMRSNGRYFGDLAQFEAFEFLDQCR